MYDDRMVSEEELTPMACMACGGDFAKAGASNTATFATRYSYVSCRWCTRGGQTVEQRGAWQAHRAGRTPPEADAGRSGVRHHEDASVRAEATAAIGALRRR